MILFLKEVADEINLSIFFSTHSLELLREIKAQNIYYLTKMLDGSIVVTNPCYPAYATRNLYGDDGYGNDMVVLVEDDLAKLIIEKIMISKILYAVSELKYCQQVDGQIQLLWRMMLLLPIYFTEEQSWR